MDEGEEALRMLRGIPGFGAVPDGVAVERLGGLTNRVWRVEVPDGPVVLRLPGAGTEDYIDREVEAVNAQAAARAGVSPEVLHVDPAAGVMVSRHVAGRTMTPEAFRCVPGAPARAGEAFRRLHRSGERFAFRFELFAMIEDYLGVLGPARRGRCPRAITRRSRKRRRCGRHWTRGRRRWRRATAIRCARTSSIPDRGCGWWTGNTPA